MPRRSHQAGASGALPVRLAGLQPLRYHDPMHLQELQQLPVAAVLGEVDAALAAGDALVLEAAPGAGKTTAVPLALLQAGWLAGRRILMLEPRRVAARAAAERMADLLGERVGETVGYSIRMERRVSRSTRIEVVTEGILTRRLQRDPTLAGVGLLIFDEFHERHLQSDLGLALALQGRELFREQDPLRLLVMSATLDGAAVAALLGGAARITAEGRAHGVEYTYLGCREPRPPPQSVARAVRRALDERTGSVLVFLPGRREIDAVARELKPHIDAARVLLAPLHGGLSLADQRRAIGAAPAGLRKVVLATNIAETSLTIDGIDTVVDSGLVREARFDPPTGTTRLVTAAVSRASAAQRAGRAGRQAPGHCYRLWSEERQGRLVAHADPEIQHSDLAALALQLLAWGEPDPAALRWLDPPPGASHAQALELLQALGAAQGGAGGSWKLTAHGERLAALPLEPRLGHLLLTGVAMGRGQPAALLAAALGEAVPSGGVADDAVELVQVLGGERSCPGHALAWRKRIRAQSERLLQLVDAAAPRSLPAVEAVDLPGVLIASAFPDRIARSRDARSRDARSRDARSRDARSRDARSRGATASGLYQLANGRSAQLPPEHALATRAWLAVADLGGEQGARADRVYLAAPLNPDHFEGVLADRVETLDAVYWNERDDQLVAERRRQVGRLPLSSRPLSPVPEPQRRAVLLEQVQRRGMALFRWSAEGVQWRARVGLLRDLDPDAGWPDLGDDALLATAEQWLAPALDRVRTLADFRALDLRELLRPLLDWPLPQELDRLAPERLQVPSGTRATLDYTASPPVMAVKLQEMFGCEDTPRIAGGRVQVQLHLLSPARRPLQVTQDLAGFWRGPYAQVRREMRGRYPKHPWPEDPLAAVPTRHTK